MDQKRGEIFVAKFRFPTWSQVCVKGPSSLCRHRIIGSLESPWRHVVVSWDETVGKVQPFYGGYILMYLCTCACIYVYIYIYIMKYGKGNLNGPSYNQKPDCCGEIILDTREGHT